MPLRQLIAASFSRLLAVVLFLTSSAVFAAASPELRTDHLHSQLVSASNTVTPGQTLKLGLLLQHDAHWHSYWKNAGDSGNATTLKFSLPEGVTTTAIEWPLPERLPVQGLVNYGYSGRVLLPVTVTVPADFSQKQLDITLKADWLVCMEECIPGEGEYHLSLPVSATPKTDPAFVADFAHSALRQAHSTPATATYGIQGDSLTVHFTGSLPADIASWNLFPEIPQHVSNAATPEWEKTAEGWQVRLPVSEYFVKAAPEFPLLLVKADEGLLFTAKHQETSSATQTTSAFSFATFLPAIGLALLGGLILNLMPCVFPVLSFKALAVLQQADNRPALRRQGIFYTLGVVLSFLALAGVLLALRSAGEQIGWGFQLQEPRFVAALVLLLFIMAMSFAGLLEIGAGLAGLGQSLTEGQGDRSAFFTGVLASVVASPCTAPFMGTALGFALSQPIAAALAVFAALGLGLALPLLLLGFVPGLARLLPRPGAWMENFRQFLAFPLLLTVVWLLWVYGEQTSALGMAWLLGALVLLAFGIWWRSKAKGRRVVTVLAWIVIALAVATPLLKKTAEPEKVSTAAEVWSAEKLATLRADKKPVLVNMTAAWCITCLANERSTLSTDSVKNALAKHGVAYLKGDWTRQDPAITDYLATFGRNGVPLYVLYPAEGEPQVLPQILTPALVEDALDSMGNSGP